MVLDRSPRTTGPGLEPDPPEDERAMVRVLELVLRVDPPADPDVRLPTAGRDLVRLGDRDLGRRGEEAADTVRGPERAQDEAAGDEGDETRGTDEQGSHGPDDRTRRAEPPVPVET